MEIGKDTFVILEYYLRLADGSYVRGNPQEGPASINFICGYDHILPALENRLLGLEEGTEVDFVIPAREAFGDHLPNLIQQKVYEEFPQGRDLPLHKWVVATSATIGAQYSYYVATKTDVAVTLDFNHPLAGKDLYYHVKVLRVRSALPEELAEVRPCEFGDNANLAAASYPG